jgi:hypothetical protein
MIFLSPISLPISTSEIDGYKVPSTYTIKKIYVLSKNVKHLVDFVNVVGGFLTTWKFSSMREGHIFSNT